MSEDVIESYLTSLEDLKMNSKPQISMLTMLAEDNEQYAKDIVRVIEEQIKKVPVARKLPIMYLIDSIIKNLSSTLYPQLFAQCIVPIFCGVFEEVDEKTRQALYKLRQTWPDIIPNKQLYLLDRKVQLIDPAWPITAKAPEHSVIHVNPKFLKPKEKEKDERSPQFSPVHSDSSVDESMREELYAKEKELQKLRLELELAETKAKLEEQKKQLEQRALAKSNKNIIDREPPSAIKLPPAHFSPIITSHPVNRDPRLSRDPRMSRDPRLKKQQERQEQERIEMEKEKTEIMSPIISNPIIDVANFPSGAKTASADAATSSRMDLATLINSFSNAAAKVAAEQAKKKNQFQNTYEPDDTSNLPDNRKIPPMQPKSNESAIERGDIKNSERHESRLSKVEPKSDKKNTEIENAKLTKDKKLEGRDTNRELKKLSNHGKERNKPSKDRKKRDSAEKDRKDGNNRDIEKDRQVSGESGNLGERRNSRERKTDEDVNRYRGRRGYREHSPDFKTEGYRNPRQNHSRVGDRERHGETVIHSKDGRSDQFGRKLRSKSGSRSRDRSPMDRDNRDTDSPTENLREDKVRIPREEQSSTHTAQEGNVESEIAHRNVEIKSEDMKNIEPVSEVSSKSDSTIENYMKTKENIPTNRDKNEFNIKKENSIETEAVDMEISEEENDDEIISMVKSEILEAREDTAENDHTTEDVDMRIQQKIVKKEEQADSMERKHAEKVKEGKVDFDLQTSKIKRPFSEEDEPRPDIRPYKIPKLGPKKFEAKSNENQEDISKLFGEEDVDYRRQASAPVQIAQPLPSQVLLSPTALNINMKSPAQRRWSQFKESHPDDFAQDMERKRLRDAQMQSMTSDVQDVDLRHMTSSRQRSLPMPPLDVPVSIPKDLSVENQEQILQRAEQELKEGRISHGDHQEIVRQLGQVYDIQKKRQNFEDRPARLDMRDPRLRGIRETRASYVEDVDGRTHYMDDDYRRGPLRSRMPAPGDGPDEPANNSPRYRERHNNYQPGYEMSPNEDFDGRRMVHPRTRPDHRMEYDRRRGPVQDFDGRSPREIDSAQQHSLRDYDDRVPHRFRDFDARHMKDVDSYNESSLDFDARRSRHREDSQRHDYRNDNTRRGSFDEFNGHIRGSEMSGDIAQSRGIAHINDRHDDIHNIRHNSPPSEMHFRGSTDNVEELRPFGPTGAPIREQFANPRLGPNPDARGPSVTFPGPQIRPEQRMPVPLGPRQPGTVQGLAGSMNQDSVRQTGGVSDPMDDPRWAAMKGLLDNEGTEELVIDGKPFELRMGTSRKLRIYGQEMHVAVDLKERGIRIDGQLVYKLGEPIKEVPAVGRTVRLYYHGLPKPIWLDGQQHEMRMDAPPRNVVVDGVRRGFQIDGRDMMILVDRLEKGPYGGPPRKIRIGGVDHEIAFQAPPRRILIDNKSCELKLDSRIPYVIIDGKPHGIRFDGEPRTVFINDQPFTIPVDRAEKIRIGSRPTYIAFGGPAHEIIINGKWFEVKFDNVPKDIHLGNRHFSIRIPGPLPRVKILDELPHDFDESRLMSSNQATTPQLAQMSESDIGAPLPVDTAFLHDLDSSKGPENIKLLSQPSSESLYQNELPGPEGALHSVPQAPDITHALKTPASDNIRPTTASEGNHRPIGPLSSDSVRFGQPSLLIPQPSQPVISQPGAASMLLQPNQLRPASNSMMGLGFPGITQPLHNPRMIQQPQTVQPVNLLAQGLLRHVLGSTLQNIPDFAAGLRALTQLGSMQQQQQQQQQMPQQQMPQPVLTRPADDEHGAVMVTGMQGGSFMSQQKPQVLMPQRPQVPMMPIAPVVQPSTLPFTIPGITGTPGIVRPASVTTTAPSVIPASTSISTSVNPSIDINNLLSKLVSVGLIKETPKNESETVPVPQSEPMPNVGNTETKVLRQKTKTIPDLTDFDSDKLKQTYKSVIDQLHEGIQCHTCAARFTMNDHEKYRAHLDWHFRQNKLEQEMVKDWIQYEELEDTVDKSRSEIFEQMRSGEDQTSGTVPTLFVRALEGKEVVKNPVATGIEGEDVCATCGDPFDQMWNEETEEWILKNTIKVDGKTYHPVCYEDAQETPTPVTVLTKNPLETQLEDMATSLDSSSTSVKVEVKTELMETTQESSTPQQEIPWLNVPIKVEAKTEPVSPTSVDDSAVKIAVTTPAETPADKVETSQVPSSKPSEVVTCQGPTLLSTIATTVVREVIPVSQDDPNSPWEMDSNPTPELSRTPTPEIRPSSTLATSASSESISSLAQGKDVLTSEEPIPQTLISSTSTSKIDSPAGKPADAVDEK